MTASILRNLFFILFLTACSASRNSSVIPGNTNAFNSETPEQPLLAADIQPQSLNELPQTQDGGFVLKPGFYETEFKTYCLQPGTPDPRQGDAYLQGPITGYRKEIVESVLLNANSDIKRLFETSVNSYETYETIAVRREQSKIIKQGVKYDQWYKQNENYYIRYFPESYKKVKIQIYIPDGLLDADNKLNGEYVVFDPTGQQAIPAFTNAQRLGIGAPVIEVIRAVIKVNKKQPPQAPKKQTKKTTPAPTHPGL